MHPQPVGRAESLSRLARMIDYLAGLTTTTPQPFSELFFQDHPGQPVPEDNFWTLWCKGRLTEADTLTIRLGATPFELTSAHLHPPYFFTGRVPFLPPNQQCQSTEGSYRIWIREKTLEFSTVLPAPSLYRRYGDGRLAGLNARLFCSSKCQP